MRINPTVVLNDKLRGMKAGEEIITTGYSKDWSFLRVNGSFVRGRTLMSSKHVNYVGTREVNQLGSSYPNREHVWIRANTKIRAKPKQTKRKSFWKFSSTDLNKHVHNLPYKVQLRACKKLGAENPYAYMEYLNINTNSTLRVLKKYRQKNLGKNFYFSQKVAIILGVGGWSLLEALVGLRWNETQYELDKTTDDIVKKYFKPIVRTQCEKTEKS